MGAGASTQGLTPEQFGAIKAEYETKKSEGLDDAALFDSMKTFLEAMAPAAPPAEEAAPAEGEAPPAEAPADAPADPPAE